MEVFFVNKKDKVFNLSLNSFFKIPSLAVNSYVIFITSSKPVFKIYALHSKTNGVKMQNSGIRKIKNIQKFGFSITLIHQKYCFL